MPRFENKTEALQQTCFLQSGLCKGNATCKAAGEGWVWEAVVCQQLAVIPSVLGETRVRHVKVYSCG